MSKLTAEKCREQFEAWWQENQHNGNPPRFGWDHYRDGDAYSDDEFQTLWEAWKASRQALEIALPLLEQQEKVCQKCDGSGSVDSGTQMWGDTVYVDCDCVIEQQNAEGGWIDWGGGECPVKAKLVEVKFRDGSQSTDDLPEGWFWGHSGDEGDIIAYRVIENDGREG